MRALERQRWILAACGIAVACIAAAVAALGLMPSGRSKVALALTGGDATRALPLLRRYGCGGCHAIPGVPGADGVVGPPLADFRQRVFIAGALPNNAGNLVKWIVEPSAVHPGTAMPEAGLSVEEARDIAAYLYEH
jgi:cytochrome c1